MAKISSAREDILNAAIELFRARGYEGVGIAELLENSGAPRGSLYFHFPGGKEQIGVEVVERVGKSVASRFRALHESGVNLDDYIVRVFKTTAKECSDRGYLSSCPMAAIAAGLSNGNEKLAAAVREAFEAWEREIAAAGEARGMTAKNAQIFGSALVAAMEGAFMVSKAQANSTAHLNAARAMRALAGALTAA